MKGDYRVGIDIGGTFTDFVLLHVPTSEIHLHKRLTTPHDPAEGALKGLHELLDTHKLSLEAIETIVHGTTLVANALLERRGAKTALLTTQGFRDVLEMGNEQRYDIHDLFLRYPEPLVPRRWRIEVGERMSRDGIPLHTPDPAQIHQQVAHLVAQGVEAIAICFLHSYRNPAHEQMVAELIQRAFPHLFVSVSYAVNPEIREFERTATTVCNAYVQPLMYRYIERLQTALSAEGFHGQFFLMQSSGGSIDPATASRFPVRLLESGPAGGALVASLLSRMLNMPDVLSFDMGGTTAKICLIREGSPEVTRMMETARMDRFKPGSGIPIQVPTIDMIEIGAGGGSIAWIDGLGLLKVGPRSAGADPGPACYGQGGEEPTVTDACVMLGYFDPDYFLGGTMKLDVAAAETALSRLGKSLGLSTPEVAWGVYSVACENMAAAARRHIIEKGADPRRYPVIAFGGAGPAHASLVTRILGASTCIIPPLSGVASALGFLVAPITFEFSRSYPKKLSSLRWDEVQALYAEMETQARQVLITAGVAPTDIHFQRHVEMRFAGQFHDIDVPIPEGPLTETLTAQLAERFEREYRRLYQTFLQENEPMGLNWRLRASGPEPTVHLQSQNLLTGGASSGGSDRRYGQNASPEQALKGYRLAFFPESGYRSIPVFDRYRLSSGMEIRGPAVVEERESTTVLRAGDVLTVDILGNLCIRVEIRS